MPDPRAGPRRYTLPTGRVLTVFACMLIVTFGAYLRLIGTNWDEGANLHPDERHMVFVVEDAIAGLKALKPGDLSPSELWFAAKRSPLDPRTQGRLYVYGELPHLVVSLITWVTGKDGWQDVVNLGRTLGAVLDSYTILAVFFLATLLCRSVLASLGAAALYAFTPLAIQNANFFTVDAWLTAATAWSLVATALLMRARGERAALACALAAGALAGAAMACKLPGLAALGAAGLAILLRRWRLRGEGWRLPATLAQLVAATFATFIVFRLTSPFHFAGPGFFGLAPSPAALDDYAKASLGVGDINFPPAWQWLGGYGPPQALADLAMWGLGPVLSLVILAAIAAFLFIPHRAYDRLGFIPVFALIAAFLAYWLSIIPALRYTLPALPALCAVAAIGFALAAQSRVGQAGIALVVIAAGIWGLGIPMLHSTTHSRVAASRWLWNETPVGTVVVNESSWNEGLPVIVSLPGRKTPVWPEQEGHFRFLLLYMEYPDSADKARHLAETLGAADYFVISSERFRKPMLKLSDHFPLSAAFYSMLAKDKLCFERVYSQPSAYPVLGFAVDDRGAQETWSVYDHPTVEIYRKLGCYDPASVERRLVQALPKGS